MARFSPSALAGVVGILVSCARISSATAGAAWNASEGQGEQSGARAAAHCLAQHNCSSCLSAQSWLACRWCVADQTCRVAGSPLSCAVPINSLGQCWGEACPYRVGDLLKDRPDDAWQWAAQTAETMIWPLAPFRVYRDQATGLFDLSSGAALMNASSGGSARGVRIAAVGDWGSGTCEARVVGKLMAASEPHHTVHLGDVYYVGTPNQFKSNMLGTAPNKHQIGIAFPKGSLSTFFMNGNHEMISGGTGLMVHGFAYTGQATSFAAYQSDRWRMLLLDTGYKCYKKAPNGSRLALLPETDAPLPREVVDWLAHVVQLGDPSDTRGVIVMTHHQPHSNWEHHYLGAAKQLHDILPENRTLIWFSGHEHRLALFEEMEVSDAKWTSSFSTHFRLVGNGGFADRPTRPKSYKHLAAFDERVYQHIPVDVAGRAESVGYNGFFTLDFSGEEFNVTYISGKCIGGPDGCAAGYDESEGMVLAQEAFSVDVSGRVSQRWLSRDPALSCVCFDGSVLPCGECFEPGVHPRAPTNVFGPKRHGGDVGVHSEVVV